MRGEVSDTFVAGPEPASPRAAERAHLLSETLGQLLSARDPDSMVRQLLPKVASHLGADAYFNFMINERGDDLYLHSCSGMPEEVARSIQQEHFGSMVASGEDTTMIRRSSQAHLGSRAGIRAYACQPLVVGGRALGTLSFASSRRDGFEPEELEFLRTISQYLAMALDRLRAARDLRKVAAEREQAEAQVRYQRDTLERIVNGAPLNEILERLTADIESLFERDLIASVFLIDSEGRYQRPVSGRKLPGEWRHDFGGPETEDFKTEALKPGPRECWSAPILSTGGHALGAFAIQYREASEPTEQEERVVDVATRLAAVAIERKQSEDALKDSQAKLREHAQTLEHRVTERTASLREAVAQMEEFSLRVA